MRAEVFRVGDCDHIVPGVRRHPPPPLDRVRCPRRISAWGTACGLDGGQSLKVGLHEKIIKNYLKELS